jgi:UDP-N-acetylmuramoyl-tripeptide--D-alanyl-D-alanine ligase
MINILLILLVFVRRYFIMLHLLQLERYKVKRFNNWFFTNLKQKSVLIPIILSLLHLITIFWLKGNILILVASLIINLAYLPFIKFKQQKVPLVLTYRIKRLLVCSLGLTAICYYLATMINKGYFTHVELLLVGMIVFNFVIYDILMIAFYLVQPIEKQIQNKFITRAKTKLLDYKLGVIGITGSYGKTSTKMILSALLDQEFYVCKTPKSFNTPMGIAITINQYLRRLDQILICEMGATRTGDIKELVDIVNPTIGIITEIGPQHLDSFCNMTNIIKTKFELIEALPSFGVAILNYDNNFIRGYKINNPVQVIRYGMTYAELDYRAINVMYGTYGSSFEVVFPNQTHHLFKTKLLGKHNIYNLLAAIAVADHYKIDINKLKAYVQSVCPIDNRVQLKQYKNFTIIDDAFNSNLDGFQHALDVLNHFQTKRILITPGIVDLGKEQNKINHQLAEQIADVCDYVVLVGLKQTQPIYEGLISKGFSKDDIFVTNEFKLGYDHIMDTFQSDFTLLIENDLPDNYSEN